MAVVPRMRDKKSGNKTWLPPSRWKLVQASVPIVCVDVLPIRTSRLAPHTVEAIGLILRDTPRQGQRWCLIGGRLLYGEPLQDAIVRQVGETLGRRVRVHRRRDQQPLYIAQYAPHSIRPFALDPRQHAVGLTYVSEMTGSPAPQGEAVAYEWFDVRKLPPPEEFGFDQDRVVKFCLQLLRTATPSNTRAGRTRRRKTIVKSP